MIEILIIAIIIVLLVRKNTNKSTKKSNKQTPLYEWPPQQTTQTEQEITQEEPKEGTGKDYRNGYQAKWLLTYNEKNAYKNIKEIADAKKYTVFTKVRLLDLVEPKSTNRTDQSYLWKIQAKHVDFVVCNENLVAKWIIELQDNSHKATNRAERDTLVKDILTACDYKVLMTYGATKEELNNFLQ